MVKGIAHLCIRVTDLDATERFYCGALGMKKAFDFLREGETVGFYLAVGNGTYIEFFRREPGADAGAELIAHLCLEVDSIDETAKQLVAAGVAITEKKLGADHAWQAWITDPDGVRIELHEYTAESSQKTGAPCIL